MIFSRPSAILLAMIVLAPLGLGQPDPAQRALSEFEKEFNGSGTPTSPEFMKAQARWPEWERIIAEETAQQQEFVRLGGRSLADGITLYEGRASLRGRAVDHYLAGRILGMADQLERAREHFEKSLAADSFFYWSNHALGTYFMRKDMHEAAASQYKRALDCNNEHVESARALAFCFVQLKEYDRADILLRQLLRVTPDDWELHRMLGVVCLKKGDHASACPCFEAYLNAHPDDRATLGTLANCYLQSNQSEQAVQMYDRVLLRNGNDFGINLQYGEFLIELRRFKEAAARYRVALANIPLDAKPELRTKLEAAIKQLEEMGDAPAPTGPPAPSIDQVLNDLQNSADTGRRQRAARMLYRARYFDQRILVGFVRALTDRSKDAIVRTYALKFIDRWIPEDLLAKDFLPVLTILLRDPDKDHRVQGMVASLVGKAGSVTMVPNLIEALSAKHPYVFREVHDALNKLTYAYVRVDLNEDMDPTLMASIRSEWSSWWEQNKTRYGG